LRTGLQLDVRESIDFTTTMPGQSSNPGPDSFRELHEAVRLSPQNIPLRQHLADSLLSAGNAAEAEQQYREALTLAPGNTKLQFGLARAFFAQGKQSHALALVETLVNSAPTSAPVFVLHARLLVGIGELEQGVRQYRRAVEMDPSAADPELAARLGIDAREETYEVVEGRVRASWQGEDEVPPAEIERPRISFSDVGGMEVVKEEIRMKIIHPLAHPELYKAYGKSIGGGILMYGPPGCGKTHLARATAGEIKAGFIAVGISDVLDMWIGNSERNLHELFEQARRNQPCVLFFDEVDALGASRADMRHSGARHLINQFLAELDGVKSSNEGVLILGATNAPWHLDSAFRRPGRFDRILFVPPPDATARAAILRIQCAGKPAQDLDLEHVAKKTEGFSGADLKAVVDVAVEAKLREAMKAGMPSPLRTKDLASSAATLKATTREWFATARNYALYSNQGGVYDDILKHLKI
ncbi:MAG: AAA family ATPase, partial [Verrucomicrobiales bacterium]|nr:AAA family ATPase [Verrucomicrobiales bacterium]